MAVASPALAPLVTSGVAETGPRKAEALSMPGLRPTAFPPGGEGGGENGEQAEQAEVDATATGHEELLRGAGAP